MITAWERIKAVRSGLIASISGNPAAWVFFVLFAIAEHANYQRGSELTRVCELTGPHTASYARPINAQEEIDTICASREPEDE